MPTVAELTALYSNFLLGPRRGPAVCEICFDLTDGPQRCPHCENADEWLDAVAPISYSVAHEQLHHTLAGYKRLPHNIARDFERGLAAVLWRYLATHECCLVKAANARCCLAKAATAHRFDLITTVPSGAQQRDPDHPLHRIVGQICGPTQERFDRILKRTPHPTQPRTVDPHKFEATRPLDGKTVLLIDDTWTTGATVQSAAQALKAAGAGNVAAVVIGRHVRRDWNQNDRRLKQLPAPFDWSTCALHSHVRPSNKRQPNVQVWVSGSTG